MKLKEQPMNQLETMDMQHLRNTVGKISGASTHHKVNCVRELWRRGDKYATYGPGSYRNEPHLPSFLTYSYRLFFPDYVYSDDNGEYSTKAVQVNNILTHIQDTHSPEELDTAFSTLQGAMVYQYTRDDVLTYDDVIVLFGIPVVTDFSTPFDEEPTADICQPQSASVSKELPMNETQLATAIAQGITAANTKPSKPAKVKTEYQARKPIIAVFYDTQSGIYDCTRHFKSTKQADKFLQSTDNPHKTTMVLHKETEVVNIALPMIRKKSK